MYHTNSSERKPVPEAAREYVDRSWNPIPVDFRSKKPSNGKEWHLIRIDNHADVAKHFNGAPQNIGVQMGPASGGLVDLDLDSPEALALVSAFAPPTGAIFGRKSTPGAHRLYVTDEISDVATIKFLDPNRRGEEALMLELRIGGGGKAAQTVFPPSVHKDTGEQIAWELYGEPALVDGNVLLRVSRMLASCCLMARYWPPTGGGAHDTALVVGGFLARAGLRPEAVKIAVKAVASFCNPDRVAELVRTAGDAAEKYYKGDRT